MGRKKKDPTTSIPQEGLPLVDSTNNEIGSTPQIDNVEVEPSNDEVDNSEIIEDIPENSEPEPTTTESLLNENTDENSELDPSQNDQDLNDLEEENADKSIKEVPANVIVLRGFDIGENHYSPLKKYLIPEEHIPELLENRKIKLICKHG